MAFLEVDNLYKTFAGTKVLQGVSFSMEKGEVVSIIGSSGSGKTTLLRCLNFLEFADSGTITCGGEQIFPLPPKGARNEPLAKPLTFGMVFQNFNLFPQYTALKNVSLALDLRDEADAKRQKRKGRDKKAFLQERKQQNDELARSLLARVGLQDKMQNYPCQLSGGQQQRVAIARALALSPDVLCFDEPTSALDPELTDEVLKVIKSLTDENRTMIIVTHEMDFAKRVSDRIIFMADGVIEEMGTPAQVFDAPQSAKTQAFLKKSNQGDIKDVD